MHFLDTVNLWWWRLKWISGNHSDRFGGHWWPSAEKVNFTSCNGIAIINIMWSTNLPLYLYRWFVVFPFWIQWLQLKENRTIITRGVYQLESQGLSFTFMKFQNVLITKYACMGLVGTHNNIMILRTVHWMAIELGVWYCYY